MEGPPAEGTLGETKLAEDGDVQPAEAMAERTAEVVEEEETAEAGKVEPAEEDKEKPAEEDKEKLAEEDKKKLAEEDEVPAEAEKVEPAEGIKVEPGEADKVEPANEGEEVDLDEFEHTPPPTPEPEPEPDPLDDEPTTPRDIPEDEMKMLLDKFKLFDRDGDNEIRPNEVAMILRNVKNNPSMILIQDILNECEDDDTCNLSRFVDFMKRFYRTPDPTLKKVRFGFREYDPEGSGVISVKELKNILINWGERFTTDEMNDFISEADPQGTGEVHYEEFVTRFGKKDK